MGCCEHKWFDFGGSKGMHLPLAELSYIHNYHSSIDYVVFEMLCERKCRSPVLWTKVGSSQLIGSELVRETTNKVLRLKRDLRQREICLKSYADDRHKPLEFVLVIL